MEDTKCRLVLAGGLGCKSQEKGLWAKLKGFTLCKPDQPPTPYPIPGLILLGFQGWDWTDCWGEIQKSGMAKGALD